MSLFDIYTTKKMEVERESSVRSYPIHEIREERCPIEDTQEAIKILFKFREELSKLHPQASMLIDKLLR